MYVKTDSLILLEDSCVSRYDSWEDVVFLCALLENLATLNATLNQCFKVVDTIVM